MPKRKKIGLALGSGGARGLSHIGVIKVLEKNNIPIDYIAGTSIGAMIGGVYAFNKDIKSIEKVFLSTDWKRVVRLTSDVKLFSGGVLAGTKVKDFIKSTLKSTDNFRSLQIPFAAVATDLRKGESVVIKSGKLIEAIRASISFPGVFLPVELNKKILIDGGITNSVPVNVVREMGADIVIAVNLESGGKGSFNPKYKGKNFYNNLITSVRIMQKSLANYSAHGADIMISPKVNNIYWNEFQKPAGIIKAGEREAGKSINKIKSYL
jgi:NTE family protein